MADELLDILLELGTSMYLCRKICADSEKSIRSKVCRECSCWIIKDINFKVSPETDYKKIVIKTNSKSQSKSLKMYLEKRYNVDCKINTNEIVISEKRTDYGL